MYAIIRAGGKQHKVAKGDVIQVEKLRPGTDALELTPLFVFGDDGRALTGKSDLAAARVTASVVGDAKGPKVDIFRYRNKTGYRRHTGHRQQYTSLRIDDITVGSGSAGARGKTGKTGK